MIKSIIVISDLPLNSQPIKQRLNRNKFQSQNEEHLYMEKVAD